jgi:hypothetical protein
MRLVLIIQQPNMFVGGGPITVENVGYAERRLRKQITLSRYVLEVRIFLPTFVPLVGRVIAGDQKNGTA